MAQEELEMKYRILISPHSPLEDTQKTILNDKLEKLFTKERLTSKRGSYVLFADLMVNNDGISAGENPTHAISVTGNVFAVDVLAQQVLGNLEIYGSATGKTPLEALQAATDSIEIDNMVMMQFFDNALAKTVEFYSEKCNEAIPNARMAMDMGDPKKAVNMLTDIPEMVGFCKEQASQEIKMIYMDYEMILCEMLNIELTNAIKNKDKKEIAKIVGKMAALSSCDERWEQRKPEVMALKVDVEAQIKKGKAYRFNADELSGAKLFDAIEKTLAFASLDQIQDPTILDMEADDVSRIVMEWKSQKEQPEPNPGVAEPTLAPAR
jgi:CheY-like chemotaxis protein